MQFIQASCTWQIVHHTSENVYPTFDVPYIRLHILLSKIVATSIRILILAPCRDVLSTTGKLPSPEKGESQLI